MARNRSREKVAELAARAEEAIGLLLLIRPLLKRAAAKGRREPLTEAEQEVLGHSCNQAYLTFSKGMQAWWKADDEFYEAEAAERTAVKKTNLFNS